MVTEILQSQKQLIEEKVYQDTLQVYLQIGTNKTIKQHITPETL